MTLNNFFYSGFEFSDDESFLQFKFKMLNSIFILATFFSAFISILVDLNMHNTEPIHSKLGYIYSFLTILLVFFLRRSKAHYEQIAHLLLLLSLIMFTLVLIFLPQDESRMIWFYLLIFGAYMLKDSDIGLLYTVISVTIILISYTFLDLNLSPTAVNTAVLGLIIGSFLSWVYTSKIRDYENNLKEKNSTLSLLASTDDLTGIMNKRMFNEISKRYFKTAQRDDLSLTFLLLDLDHFKHINDTYGHQAGDMLLKYFAKTVGNTVRESDIFARIGGEEFAILILNTDTETVNTSIFAEKIRKNIENISMEYEGQCISTTTSIGIAKNNKSDNSFDDIFFRADMGLYKAKNEGRNQACYVQYADKNIKSSKSKEQKVFLNFSI